MKINIEKLFVIIFVVVLSAFAIYFINSNPDIYVHYLTAREILKDPSFLWRTNLTGLQNMLSQGSVFITYPPLLYLFYACIMAVGLPLFIATILSVIAIGYIIYKINGLAIPFLFLSFMFVREVAFNGYDIPIVALTLASFYLLMKKKFLASGVLVGLTALIKITGVFVVISWIIAMIVFERKNIKPKYLILTLIVTILISSSWYIRNFTVTHDVYLAALGLTKEIYAKSMNFLSTPFQMSQPERFIWDSSGYYPLPIDLLFYIGTFFFVLNLIRTKKIQPYSILVALMILLYFIFQLSGTTFFVVRHEMLIFPFLALEIANGIPKKYLKYSLIVCIIFLVFWSLNLSKYSFNQYSEVITPACDQIKSAIDNEPVYVNAFHNWFVIYKCDLNATIQSESKWTLDFDSGKLYATNITNTTGV